MTKKAHKQPSVALVKELSEVLDKHGWPTPVSVVATPASASAEAPGPCPPGQTLQDVNVQLGNGSVLTIKMCR
jgi:hypothetical protein